MSGRPWVVALAGWTFLVWTTRISNIWTDADLSTGDKWARTALAASFTVLGLVVVAGLVRRASWLRSAAGALAAWSTVVWVIRGAGIAVGDHDLPFIAVHLVLGLVSIALSALAWREVSSRRPTASRPAPG